MTQQGGLPATLEGAREVLRHTFGHEDFRGLQAGVITEVLAGRPALAVLPASRCATRSRPSCGLAWALSSRP